MNEQSCAGYIPFVPWIYSLHLWAPAFWPGNLTQVDEMNGLPCLLGMGWI